MIFYIYAATYIVSPLCHLPSAAQLPISCPRSFKLVQPLQHALYHGHYGFCAVPTLAAVVPLSRCLCDANLNVNVKDNVDGVLMLMSICWSC